jgi:carboxymethylenebutenolidase
MVDMAPTLQTPWLGLFGEEDQNIPVRDVERLRDAAAAAEIPTEVVVYPGAGHGFHCDARPQSYHEPSAKDAWDRTLAWFDVHVPSD